MHYTPRVITRTAAVGTEQLIRAGRGVLWAVLPELTTTGTITIRDGALADGSGTIIAVCAAGLTQAGKLFLGAQFLKGLTIQSSASEQCAIIWEAIVSGL